MLIHSTQLFNLPVHTHSGIFVGKINGFEFEVETQTILRYEVSRGYFFVRQKLLIHRTQVLSITADKMVVEDGAVPAREARRALVVNTAPEQKPAPLTSQDISSP